MEIETQRQLNRLYGIIRKRKKRKKENESGWI